MALYIFLGYISCYLGSKASKTGNIKLVYLIIFIFAFFSGFRAYTVGIDTENYCEIYENIGAGLPTWEEPGFTYLCLLLNLLSPSPTTFFVVSSFVTFSLFILRLWDFRTVSSFGFMVLCFYLCFFMRQMNISRQIMAISILFYSTKFLFDKKYFYYFLSVCLATTLHYTSLIGVVLFSAEFLNWRSLSLKCRLILIFGIICAIFTYGFIMTLPIKNFSHYLESSGEGIGFMLFIKLFIVVMVLLLAQRNNQCTKGGSYNYMCTLRRTITYFYLIGILLQGLGYYYSFVDRISLLFMAFEPIFWGIMYKNNRNLRKLIVICIVLLLVYPFVLSLIVNSLGTMPYLFIWSTNH